MSLILTILNKPNPGQEISSAFETGGTIGRAPDNTWVLVDPERFTSSKHAQIQFNNGEYFLTDLSTNGVFVNSSSEPLGNANTTVLKHGDKLKIGQYEISVTIQAGSPLPLGDPDSSPFGNTFAPASPALGENAISSDDLGKVNEPTPLGIGGKNGLDPLAAFNNGSPAQPSPTKSSAMPNSLDALGIGGAPSPTPSPFTSPPAERAPVGTTGDNASPLQQQFEPPRVNTSPAPASPTAAAPGSMIPDDWQFGSPAPAPEQNQTPTPNQVPAAAPMLGEALPGSAASPFGEIPAPSKGPSSINDLLGGVPAAEAPQTNPSIPQTPETPPATPSPGIPNATAPGGQEIPSMEAFLAPSSTPPSSAQPTMPGNNIPDSPPQIPTPMAPQQQQATPQQAPTQQPTASAIDSGTVQNLLKGMGLEHLRLTPQEEADLMLSAGQLVQASVEGLVTVLHARAKIKNEFRITQTQIQASENNPLKFSPTGRDALNHMFTPGTSSYMPAVQAVSEGFNDMEAHLMAVMAGMQTALHTVLKRFDPAMLEREFEQREKGKGFSLGSKKAKHWDVYNTHYIEIIASVEDDFQTLFGDEFSRAYEEQVAKLKAARTNNH
ncbi:type VI secretion system-associated FHA domain protein TagH [Pseudomonadota bacterium]